MAQAKKATSREPEAASKQTKEKQVKHAEVVVEAAPTDSATEVKMQIETEETKPTAAKAGDSATKPLAKSGKRSAKAAKEAEARQAKEVRKVETAGGGGQKAKLAAKPARSRTERAGKKYREAAKLIDKTKNYPSPEALELAVKTSPVKFDASVELHINLGVDPKQADQNVRDSVALPAGTGKTVKVASVSNEEEAAKLFAKLDKEKINFDILVVTPQIMPQLGKYARLLGPRGLMPNPKSGTVTTNVAAAVQEALAGKVEYRVDQAGIIHLAIGKVSFGPEKLRQNAEAVLASVRAVKPASLKGLYVKSAYISTTMGPAIKLEIG